MRASEMLVFCKASLSSVTDPDSSKPRFIDKVTLKSVLRPVRHYDNPGVSR
jgi:hypothetical protein